MIGCSEAIEQLWEYLDRTVSDADRETLEEHLGRCRRCCAELEFAEALRASLAASATEAVPDHVMARLNATLEELSHE